MYNGIKFLSVFKIEDKPILRPCLSESKREEIQRFKTKALEIEHRLAQRHENSLKHNTVGQVDHIDFHENIQSDLENSSVHSEIQTDNDVYNDNFVTSISEWDISSIPGTDLENGTISLYSALTETPDNQENGDETAGQPNNTFMPLPSTIIRSDSFIVDEPSECFLKQLEDTGVIPSNSASLTDVSTKTVLNQTKIFIKPEEKRKAEAKKYSNLKLKKFPTKPFPFKKGRVASDNISNLPEKLIRKCQNGIVSSREKQEKSVSKQSASTNQTRKSTTPVESTFTQTDNSPEYCQETATALHYRIAEMMTSVEERFHNETVLFLDKQKREQEDFLRKLLSQVKVKQDAFHNSLIMQLKTLLGDGVSHFAKNQDNQEIRQSDSFNFLNDVNGNLSLPKIRSNDCSQREMNEAATKINAFVRGYLTRRLFKTEHVQEVIKAIHDTLNLVIDLHFENSHVESEADIQMKHNLLRQLESCHHNLSQIFITNSRAEQMAMIAVDREMKTHRLLANTNKGPSNTNRPISTSVEDKLKKLKVIEL